MSTGFECEFFCTSKTKWYYLLQNWDCPVGAWDWTEYASCYGPFPNLDVAEAHLSKHHANPGGYSVIEKPIEPKDHLVKLIKESST